MTQDNGASSQARMEDCTCGASADQPADHHDISCSVSLNFEPDLSWFLIAVGKRKISGGSDVVILDHSWGWESFGVEFYWEDTFTSEPPTHLQPGAYRWSGYTIGCWGEDDLINVTGGTFEREITAPKDDAQPSEPQS